MQQQPTNKPASQPKAIKDVAGVMDDVVALNDALNAAVRDRKVERRQVPRVKYQVEATLEPVAENAQDVNVFTRDADPKGTGFVSSKPMPEGSRAVLHLPPKDGQTEPQRIECRVRRSREIANGLFEGSVEFLGNQPQFSDTRIKAPQPAPRRK
jgi:hypothetical protein